MRGERAPLPDTVQVLYVSPLKALSNDIEKNLQAPLNGIRDALFEQGRPDVGIRTAVRTGDTSASERTLMRKLPPHVLVTAAPAEDVPADLKAEYPAVYGQLARFYRQDPAGT